MKRVSNQQGFSLIEVLLAMALLSIGLVGVLSLHVSSSKYNTGGNITTIASMIAQQRIEEVCSRQIGDVTSLLNQATSSGKIVEEVQVNADGVKDSSDGIFSRQTKVFSTGNSFVKKVVVTVSWTRGGSPKNVSYTALTRGNTSAI